VHRVGVLSTAAYAPNMPALVEGQRSRGLVEGDTLAIQWRLTSGPTDQIPAHVADLVVAHDVDVIVVASSLTALAARQATSTMSITFVNVARDRPRSLLRQRHTMGSLGDHIVRRRTQRASIVLLASLIGVVLLASTPVATPPAQAADTFKQGLQDGWSLSDSGVQCCGQLLLEELPKMAEVGSRQLRVNLRLGACFRDWTTPVTSKDVTTRGCDPSVVGKTAVGAYDPVLADALARGFVILGLLSNESWQGQQSAWTANNAENSRKGTGDNRYIQDFAQKAAGVLASAYDGHRSAVVNGTIVSLRISSWQLWNEPNAWEANPGPGVYTGSSFIYPSNFAWLLKRGSASIKAAQPSATVLSGGLFGHDIGGAPATVVESTGRTRRIVKQGEFAPPRSGAEPTVQATSCLGSAVTGAQYLCSTYDMGVLKAGWSVVGGLVQGPFNQVGQHLYIDQGSATTGMKISTYLNEIRTVYTQFEGTNTAKVTAVTEFGWATPSVTESVQADNLELAFSTFQATTWVVRGYWYRTQDLGVANDYYGLFRGDGTRKPAGTRFLTLAGM
jgi:hypothetical protein